MIVCILERALPSEIRDEWEKSLEPNVMLDFKQFYKFIHRYITRINKIDWDTARSLGGQSGKRSHNGTPQNGKTRRSNSGARAFVTSSSVACTYCGQGHLIYKCTAFEKLNVSQRWKAVKAKSLCFNCLREHNLPCNSTKNCRKCEN